RTHFDDAARTRASRRPEHLRDVRTLIDLVEGARWKGDRSRFARRCILQQNLFALCTSPAAARRTVRALLEYGGVDDRRSIILDGNVARSPRGHGQSPPPESSTP